MLKKKINEVYIGSNNKGKLREIRDLLPKRVKIFSPKNKKIKSPKETGKTFVQNSIIKAKYYSKLSGKICLADDSGLEINILDNSPGIFSSRWGGKKNNFNLAINKIYKKIRKKKKNWKDEKLKARFKCALTLYGPKFKRITVLGIVHGYISKIKLGDNGFGYDPIFVPKGKKITFAQMKPKDKYKIDHRMKAFRKIRKFF